MKAHQHLWQFQHVFRAVAAEAEYQDLKWGEDKQQSLEGYLLVVRAELDEAITGWLKNKTGRNSCLSELIQVATTALRAVEEHSKSHTDYTSSDTYDFVLGDKETTQTQEE